MHPLAKWSGTLVGFARDVWDTGHTGSSIDRCLKSPIVVILSDSRSACLQIIRKPDENDT
jgi:hypothetical protein